LTVETNSRKQSKILSEEELDAEIKQWTE